MNARYHVLVAGAGPAGSALSLTLARRGLSVLLVEQSHLQNNRVGELLSPDGVQALRQLLPESAESFLQYPLSVVSAWNSEQLVREYHSPFRPWRAVERSKLDHHLASEAHKQGASLKLSHKIRKPRREGTGWSVELEHGGRCETVTADFLVDATGRAATLAKSLGASRIFRSGQIGLVGFLECPEQHLIPREMILESSEHGWWYAAPIKAGSAVAVLITDNDLDKGQPDTAWQTAFSATEFVRRRFSDYTLREKPHRVSAESSLLVPSYGDGWMAVGDAASCFDPLSSLGVGRALREGQKAGHFLADTFYRGERPNPRKLAESTGEEFINETRTLAGWYGRVKRWPNSIFWQRRGLSSSPYEPYKVWRRTYTPPRKVAITWGRGIEWSQYLELEQHLLCAPDVNIALRELRWSLSLWACHPEERPLLKASNPMPEPFLVWLDELLVGSLLCCLERKAETNSSELFSRLCEDQPVTLPSLGWSGRFSELADMSQQKSLVWLSEEVTRYQKSLIEGKFLITRAPLLQNLCLLSVLPLFILITTLMLSLQRGAEEPEREGYEQALEAVKETTQAPLDQLPNAIAGFHLDKALELLQTAQLLLPYSG